MEPLQLNRELLTYICMCTPAKGTSLHVRVCHQILFVIILTLLMFGWIASVVYIALYVKSDLRGALYAIFQVAAEFSASYTVLSTYLHPDATLAIFNKFKYIRDSGNIS